MTHFNDCSTQDRSPFLFPPHPIEVRLYKAVVTALDPDGFIFMVKLDMCPANDTIALVKPPVDEFLSIGLSNCQMLLLVEVPIGVALPSQKGMNGLLLQLVP